MGNPFFKIKCEKCNAQFQSFRDYGLASFYSGDTEEIFESEYPPDFQQIKRNICNRCSDILGWDD